MQAPTIIQAFSIVDVIKRIVDLTKQGYEVDYSARVYPRFVGNKYVVTMRPPEQEVVVEQKSVEDVVVQSESIPPQEPESEKKSTRAKKKPVEADLGSDGATGVA